MLKFTVNNKKYQIVKGKCERKQNWRHPYFKHMTGYSNKLVLQFHRNKHREQGSKNKGPHTVHEEVSASTKPAGDTSQKSQQSQAGVSKRNSQKAEKGELRVGCQLRLHKETLSNQK